MNKRNKELLLEMLEDLSERYSTDGCNDWEVPDGWSSAELDEFEKSVFETLDLDHGHLDNMTVLEYIIEIVRKDG